MTMMIRHTNNDNSPEEVRLNDGVQDLVLPINASTRRIRVGIRGSPRKAWVDGRAKQCPCASVDLVSQLSFSN